MMNVPKMGTMWMVELIRNRYAQPQYRSKWVAGTDCEVWCPVTVDGTWIAKRNGKVFITGNSPIQCFAAKINLMVLLQMVDEFPWSVFRPIATVHDSILAEVRRDAVPAVSTRIVEIMRAPALFKTFEIELSVPLDGECKIGPWGNGISLEKWQRAQC
jgi:hypothetical protein